MSRRKTSFGKATKRNPPCRGCGRRAAAIGSLGFCARCRPLAPTADVMAAAARRNTEGKR
jgi:hypothetical protein